MPTKEELRKLCGIIEPTEPPDPAVVARRGIHEAAIKWVNTYPKRLSPFISLFGFFVLLLPVFLKPWREIIQATPILGYLFESFSQDTGIAFIGLRLLLILGLLRILLGQKKKTILGTKQLISQQDITDLDIYPTTRKREIGYWYDLFLWTIWPIVYLWLFGVLAYIFT